MAAVWLTFGKSSDRNRKPVPPDSAGRRQNLEMCRDDSFLQEI